MGRATLRALRDLCALYDPTERFLALRLELRTTSGRPLVSGGGIWDLRRNEWYTPAELRVLRGEEIDETPQELIGAAHVLTIEESQVAYVQAFAEWLLAFHKNEPRPTAVDVLAGKRRAGKTFVMVACVLLAAVACPHRIDQDGLLVAFVGWLVVPSFPEQREMHEDVLAVLSLRRDVESRELCRVFRALPERWWRYRPHPNNCYVFVSGATVYLKSANRPDSLKQGRVDVVGLNEGQKTDSEAPVHCAGNTVDLGGLLMIAANAPRRARGEWLREIKYAVDDGRALDPEDGLPVVRWFNLDPAGNTRVNQNARRKFRIFSMLINPRLARADADAEWDQLQDTVFFAWKPELAIDEVPAHWVNCTGEVIAAMKLREYIRAPSTYTSFGGVDFNKWPWFAFLGLKAYRVPELDFQLVYVVDREFRNEQDRDRPMTERQVIVELFRAGWDPIEILWIADPSGQWQSSEHRRKGGVTAGHSSYDLFRSPTAAEIDAVDIVIPPWDMFAPTTWRFKDDSGAPKYYAHPRVIESIDECNDLFRQDRIYVLKSCEHFIEACKRAPMDPKGRGVPQELKDLWHIIDAFRYPIHRAQAAMEPKVKPRRGGGGQSPRGSSSRRVRSTSFGSGIRRGIP